MARKEVVFGMKIDGDDAIKDIKTMNKELEELSDGFVEVSSDISLMEDKLYSMALAGEQNTKEFKQLQEQTAKYKQIVIETDRSIDALAEQGRGLSSALAIGETTVAGFQAFTGVTALMGSENEELLETITKLQAAQGVLNSIEVIKQQLQNNSIKITQAQTFVQKLYNTAVGNGTKAMQGFRKALLFSGIGAVIAGITLLITHWDDLTAAIFGNSEAQKLNNEVMKTAVSGIADELSASDKLQKTLNNEQKTREEKVEAVKELQAQYPNLLSNVDAEKDGIDKINEALILNTKLVRLKAQAEAVAELRAEEFKKQTEELIDAQTGQNESFFTSVLAIADESAAKTLNTAQTKVNIKATQEQINALDDLDETLQKQIESLKESGAVDGEETEKKIDNTKKLADARKKAQDDYNRMLLDQAELEEELRRMRLDAEELEEIAIADKYDKLFERAEGNAELERQVLEAQEVELNALFEKRLQAEQQRQIEVNNMNEALRQESLDRIALAEEEFLTSEKQKEINAVTDKYFELITLAEQNGENTLILKEAQEQAIAAIEDKYREEAIQKDKEAGQKRKEAFDSYVGAIGQGLNAVTELSNTVTEIQLQNARGNAVEEEKIRKKAFERNKKLQIATAIINGIQSVQAALTLPPPVSYVLAGLNGALAVANVVKIAQSKYEGGSGSAGSISAATPSGAGAGSFSIGDNTNSDQTFLNADGTQQGDNKAPVQKVIVTETDITDTQNNVNSIDVKSTF